MRDEIILKIESIKFQSDNFNKNISRWRTFVYEGKHISEVIFTDLTDNALLFIFEKIIVRMSKQM